MLVSFPTRAYLLRPVKLQMRGKLFAWVKLMSVFEKFNSKVQLPSGRVLLVGNLFVVKKSSNHM
jgi:hypothetical protein